MSNRDGFTGGFLAGAVVGGLLGGVLGVLLSRRTDETPSEADDKLRSATVPEASAIKGRSRPLKQESIEAARRSLEDKISQLNEAIDEVRVQLRDVNGTAPARNSERSLAEDA
ncbi:hypothetical protein [Kamptonema formosum]|uniref:hypothetical protein n=1 Tax=Kamptonema formosum TaxID=331992 RepID=UPI00034A7993|nr:hypothetical protein [Oscillatoria sp. PCC 10802]